MKIAVYHNQPSGGARRALYELGKQLSRRHVIDVYTLATADESFLSSRDFASSVTVLPFAPRRPLRGGFYLNDARRLQDVRDLESLSRTVAGRIDDEAYDVALVDACRFVQTPSVLSHLNTPNAYYCHHAPRRFLEEICRPATSSMSVYARARTLWHRPATMLYDSVTARIDKRNVAAADVVLTNSEHTRGVIRNYYGRDSSVCLLGVDCARFTPNSGERGDYVLAVGALEPHKGYEFLIRALARVRESDRPRLVIVGNTDDAGLSGRLVELAAALGVRMEILTHVDPLGDELLHLYQRAKAFVFTAFAEPFGLVLLEAMACGIPVVSVDEGGPREIVSHGSTGFLAPRDEAAFADALGLVLSDTRLAERLGRDGRRSAAEMWTWEAAGERIDRQLAALATGEAVMIS